ncbi:MAG: hypothetical protein HZB67_05655 [Candidatus Aenigmarchaeota archaeon]|nr:hypothetical protein [Candidatus Aenigmarchaeota archaeon]
MKLLLVILIVLLVFISGCASLQDSRSASTMPKSGTVNELSDTERHGRITSDETWSGTIKITGDIIVSRGTTLTIRPGTTVLVAANMDAENLMTIPFWLKKGIAMERD